VVRALRAPVAAEALPYAVTVRRPGSRIPSPALGLADGLDAVPGLQVQSRYSDALGDRIVLRGFGARSQFGVRGIHILVDGVPATMPDGQSTLNHLDLAVLERAEVLRGPAAAAYGNAAGGVLRLETRPPPAVGFRQAVEAGVSGGARLRLRATSGGAGRGGGAGWVASVTREAADGFRPHSGTERYQLTGRYETPVSGGFLRLVAHGVTYDADNPGSLTPTQFRDDPTAAQAFNVVQGTGEEGRHGQVGAVWERPLAGARLEAALYGLVRSLDNPIPPAYIDLERRAGGVRLLARREPGDGEAVWVIGVDAALQADDRRNHENVEGERGALTLSQTERVATVGVHGQIMVPLGGRVAALAGARYDRAAFSATDRFTSDSDPDDSGRRTMDAVSPTAGVRVDLGRGLALFGNISTAFETPTTTELVNRPDGSGGFNDALEPQRTVSWEGGVRLGSAPGLRLEAVVYTARVRDALVPFEVPTAPGRQFYRNAGRVKHEGVELLAELRVGGLEVLAAHARTRARFTSFETADGSRDGHRVPGVRPWTLETRLTARHLTPLVLEATYRAVGEMVADDANEVRAPGYGLLGVRGMASGLSLGPWTVSPYAGVENLADEAHVASIVPNAFGDRYFEPGPGRTAFVGLEVTWPADRPRP
jgi:iron complex outermembrane receptor protein